MRSHANPSPSAESPDPTALTEAVASRLRQAMFDAILRIGGGGDSGTGDDVVLTVARAPEPIAPARLARAHPAGTAREDAHRLYERCLLHYRTVVRAQDQAHGVDDVGAAVAAFVAANIGALQGTQATPPVLLRLERQLAGIVRLSSAWDSAPARERQAYFEQMAVLAVLIAECSAQAVVQGPAAVANVQRAARGYLQELLGLDPDGLSIGPDGLVPRSPA